jgi:hypothetical protein
MNRWTDTWADENRHIDVWTKQTYRLKGERYYKQTIYIYIYIYIYIVCSSVCLFVCLFICLSVQSILPSVRLNVSVCPFICLFSPSACLLSNLPEYNAQQNLITLNFNLALNILNPGGGVGGRDGS